MPIDSTRYLPGRRVGAVLAGAAVVGASLMVVAPAAHAAEDVIIVTSDATTNDPGTLRAALEAANASTNPDGVRIEFATGLGEISFAGATDFMSDEHIGAIGGNHTGTVGTAGARFVVDSAFPVTIDFTNLPAITTTTDHDFAGIYVVSDDVVLQNLANLKAGAAGIAIAGSSVTVSNVDFIDSDSIISEIGVALLDGASDITLQDLDFASQWWASIMIDGSVNAANGATVSNITIDNITSRGVESGIGHIDIEDNATVNGLTVRNSTFGATDESHTSHAVYLNTALTVTDLVFEDNHVVRGSGAEKNAFYFENATNSTFTGTVIADNFFEGTSRTAPLSRIIGDNNATWEGLEYTGNVAEYTRGIRMSGTVSDALFADNTFFETREPADAAITLGRAVHDVTVQYNVFDTVWALDAVRVEGTIAENVLIASNDFLDFHADISRSAVAIFAPGTGNAVTSNWFIQDLTRQGVDLPTHTDNHWAVRVWPGASAGSPSADVGWSILDNAIDGYGGKDRSQAPIVHDAIGKLPVTGNTFGPNTRGGLTTDVEHSAYWFLWNVHDNRSNNTVQTYRAEGVSYDGTNATFTAVDPAPLIGNNAATAPVTLHVYWTPADNADVYLGAIHDVTPGGTYSIPTTETTGFIRLQTVDANGYTSQYSSIDPELESELPEAVAVTDVTEETAAGTGEPGATFTVRDDEGNVIATGTVGDDGAWSAEGLECGTTYTVTQEATVGTEVYENTEEFTTTACDVAGPAPVTVDTLTEDSAAGTGEPGALVHIHTRLGVIIDIIEVAEDGTWSAEGLECGTEYGATQVIGDEDGDAVWFMTADCPATDDDDELPATGGSDLTGQGLGAALLALFGGALLLARRRAGAQA